MNTPQKLEIQEMSADLIDVLMNNKSLGISSAIGKIKNLDKPKNNTARKNKIQRCSMRYRKSRKEKGFLKRSILLDNEWNLTNKRNTTSVIGHNALEKSRKDENPTEDKSKTTMIPMTQRRNIDGKEEKKDEKDANRSKNLNMRLKEHSRDSGDNDRQVLNPLKVQNIKVLHGCHSSVEEVLLRELLMKETIRQNHSQILDHLTIFLLAPLRLHL